MPEPVLPFAIITLLADAIQFVADVKDAPEQIGFLTQNLEILFHLLGRVKTRLEYVQEAGESAVDRKMIGTKADGIFNTCRELNLILGPFRDAAGAARNGWWTRLRWRLKKRRLNALEAELERWEHMLNMAFNVSHWRATEPSKNQGQDVHIKIEDNGEKELGKPIHQPQDMTTSMSIVPQSPNRTSRSTPREQHSIGSLRESINRSSWNVEEAEKRAFYERLDEPSCTSLPMHTSRELLSARSLSRLSTQSELNSSMLDLPRNLSTTESLQIIKHRLRLQDAEIEKGYTRNLSASRLEAYRQLHSKSPNIASASARPVPRSFSAPHLGPSTSDANDVPNGAPVDRKDTRSHRSSKQRISSSSSQLGSIEEGEPPVVRRHTKPLMEHTRSLGSIAQRTVPTGNHTMQILPHPTPTIRSDRATSTSRHSIPATPLAQSSRSHNSMRMNSLAETSSPKPLIRDKRTGISLQQNDQENLDGPPAIMVVSMP